MEVRGLEILSSVIGKSLTGARRYVLGEPHDAFGHGITELAFEDAKVIVRGGPDEDYLVIETGPLDTTRIEPAYWTEVDLVRDHAWRFSGTLTRVDVYTFELEDVALLFHFDSGEQFSIVLCDTDVAVGRGLERFADDPNRVRPALRTTIAETRRG
jgi:hypothetical protein